MSRDNNNSGKPKNTRSSTRNSGGSRAPKSGNSSTSNSFKKPFKKSGEKSFDRKDRNENGNSKFEKKPFSRSIRDDDGSRSFSKPDSRRSDNSYQSRMDKKYGKAEQEPYITNKSEERKPISKRGGIPF